MSRVKLNRAEYVEGAGKVPEGGVIEVPEETALRWRQNGLASPAGDAKLYRDVLREQAREAQNAAAAQLMRDQAVSAAWDADMRSMAAQQAQMDAQARLIEDMQARLEAMTVLRDSVGTPTEPGPVNVPVDPAPGSNLDAAIAAISGASEEPARRPVGRPPKNRDDA